jgi:hypothetical protein
VKPWARLPRINAMTREDTVTVLLTGVLAGYWLAGQGESLVEILRPFFPFWS